MPDNANQLDDSGWNALLMAHGIFYTEINTIESKYFNKTAVLTELYNLLLQDSILQTLFNNFLVEFNVETENSEKRRQIFAKNLLQIAEHNIDARRGVQTWFQGVNRFTYLADAEFIDEFKLTPPKGRKLRKMFRSCLGCSCIRKSHIKN